VFVAQVVDAAPRGEVVQAFAVDVAQRECRRVLPPVRAFPADYIQLAGDGRVLVSPGSSRTITVADPITGRREELRAPADGITVSPELGSVAWVDGRRILVQSYGNRSKRVIAEVEGASVVIGPMLWSSSGEWLTYVVRTGGGRDGPLVVRVHVVSREGGEPRTVHEEPGYDSEPIGRFSPDGTTIAVTGSAEGLFTITRDGSRKRILSRTFVQSQPPPRWSPDGTRIAYVGTETILCEVPPIVETRGGVWISRTRDS
jgi:hypothetical protein